MRKHVLFILAAITALPVFGQESFRKNDLYFEFLGNGILASVNYERQLTSKPGVGIRLGVGYWSGDEKFRATFPLGLNYLFHLKNNKSFLDAGVGGTWSYAAGLKTIRQEAATGRDYGENIWSLVPSVGYRRHTKGNFMWRTSFTPVINKYRLIPMIGLSFGKRL